MIRKQVYLGPGQDRKLKALAAQRRCTEAAIIRDALDRLPDPEGDIVARLAAAGMLAPKPADPSLPRGAELRALEKEVETWLVARGKGLGLSEALAGERADRV